MSGQGDSHFINNGFPTESYCYFFEGLPYNYGPGQLSSSSSGTMHDQESQYRSMQPSSSRFEPSSSENSSYYSSGHAVEDVHVLQNVRQTIPEDVRQTVSQAVPHNIQQTVPQNVRQTVREPEYFQDPSYFQDASYFEDPVYYGDYDDPVYYEDPVHLEDPVHFVTDPASPDEHIRSQSIASSSQEYWEDGIDVDNMTYEELLGLGEAVGTQSRGLSKELIASLPVSKYKAGGIFSRKKSHNDQCVICQMEYKRRDRQITLPCKHVYHAKCATKWLSLNKACPVCFAEVSGDTSRQ